MRRGAVLWFTGALALLILAPLAQRYFEDTNLPPLQPASRWVINLLYVHVAAAYFWALRTAAPGGTPGAERRGWWVLAAALPLCLCWPVFSGDLWEYLLRGRMMTQYHHNPYLYFTENLSSDPMYAWTSWRRSPQVYGPLATGLQALASWPFPHSMTLSAFAFKLLLIPFWIWGSMSFLKLQSQDAHSSDSVRWAGWILSPLILVATFLDGHNDILPTAACLAAFAFAWQGRKWAALLAWSAAFAVKYHVVLVWPALFLVVLGRPQGDGRIEPARLLRDAAGFAAVQAALVAAIFLPVPGIFNSFAQLSDNAAIFYSNSIPYAVHLGLTRILGGAAVPEAWLARGFFAAFVLVCIWGFREAWEAARRGEAVRLFRALAVIHLAFYAQLASPLNIWYLVWALPWLALSRWPRAEFLLPLYSFGALFGYFKRINFVILLAAAAYALVLLADRMMQADKQGGRRAGTV